MMQCGIEYSLFELAILKNLCLNFEEFACSVFGNIRITQLGTGSLTK